MMEAQNHIKIQMIEEMGQSRMVGSKVITTALTKQPPGATVSFHGIQYSVTVRSRALCVRKSSTKDILVDLSGIMRPGLNAILGPTGSGKTSFLDVLAARKDPSGLSGDVLIDGSPQPPHFKCLSGYVVQDDIVTGALTVRENLSFSAALRLPSCVGPLEKEARVSDLISELGLSKVADKRVGTRLIRGISGGERKRTSIGMELIINPRVLFLDEPTTGLDASTAHSVLQLLKRMADDGCTIIMSVHQPRYSTYQFFDSLTLLANGRQVYHGPAHNALDYFANIGYTCEVHNNPADYILDVLSDKSVAMPTPNTRNIKEIEFEQNRDKRRSIGERLAEEYKNSRYAQDTKAELDQIIQDKDCSVKPKSHTVTYNSGFFQQLYWVLRRTFRNLMLKPKTSIAQVAVTTLMALAVGVIFFGVKHDQSSIENRSAALFYIKTNQCFSTLSAAELFIAERKLFVHENISGYYRVSVYFLSKILCDIFTLRTVPTVIFSCVSYFMIGFKPTAAAFFIFMLTVMQVAYAATAVTMAISADQSAVAVANIFMTITFVFMMMFSGRLVNLETDMVWLAWLKYFSIPHYGLTALEINEFVGLQFCDHLPPGQMPNKTQGLMCTGEQQLESQGINYSTWGLWQNHVALAIMTIIFLLIAYIKLRFLRKFS